MIFFAMTEHEEIERRYLVSSFPTEFRVKAKATWMYQGYLLMGNPSVRVRLQIGAPFYVPSASLQEAFGAPPKDNREGWSAAFTVKTREGVTDDWTTQREHTIVIPDYVGWPIFTKIRHQTSLPKGAPWLSKLHYHVGRFELHVFAKFELQDLAILEIELKNPDERVELPEGFRCVEITQDNRFSNQNLSKLSRQEFLALMENVQKKGGNR